MNLKDIENLIYGNLEKVKVSESKEEFLELSDPILDRLIFGKGFPLHSIIQFTGNPHSYKSSFASNIAGMLKRNNKCVVLYLDSEHSMRKERLLQLGLDIEKIITGITVEKVSGILYTLADTLEKNKELQEYPFVIIWDSVAATPTEAELNSDDINKTIGLKARILSALIPKWISEIFSKYRVSLLTINQLRDKVQMNPYAPPGIGLKNLGDKTLPGGNALQYLSSLILENRVRTEFDESTPYGFKGKVVEVKTVKNKYFIDNLKIDLIFSPITGYVPSFSQFELLKGYKKVLSSGPVWKFESDKNVSFRLRELNKKLVEDKEFREFWILQLNDVIDTLIKNATFTSSPSTESSIELDDIE